jgi:hypothetical protein
MVQPAIPPDPPPDPTRDALIFFFWMAACIALLISTLYVSRRHAETAGFVLVPALCLALFYDNLTIAVSAVSGGNGTAEDGTVVSGMQKLRAAVQSFVIPLFLVAEFELNYEVR